MKSITIKNKEINVSKISEWIVEDERDRDEIVFNINDEELTDLSFYLLYRNSDGKGGVERLIKLVDGSNITLLWNPTQNFTQTKGQMLFQIVGFEFEKVDDEWKVKARWSTLYAQIEIQRNIEVDQLAPSDDGTLIEGYLERLEDKTDELGVVLEDYTDNELKPDLAGYVNDVLKIQLSEYETGLEDSLEEYTTAKKTEINSYTTIKKNELDSYTTGKKDEISTHTDTKKTELDTYAAYKKSEISSYVDNTSKPAIDYYVENTSKPSIYSYVENTSKAELDEYVAETSKPALLDYVEDTLEPALASYTDDKKTELNTHTTQKKAELDTYNTAKKGELDSYVANTSKPSIDSHVANTSKPSIDSYVDNTSKPEIDEYVEEHLSQIVFKTDIVNNTSSTATDKPLSANMGNDLQQQINNLKSRGRFLSLWDCETGLPITNPPVSPYQYRSGDYYIVSNVGGINFRPDGSSYVADIASTTIETEEVLVDSMYHYDGTNWSLLSTADVDVYFADIHGSPNDNISLKSALDSKYVLPSGGMPKSDMDSGVQTSLGKADTAYQKPSGGIPKADLASGVQGSLGLADTAYQKPSEGIPKSDLVAGVQTSLGKADTAYQKPSTGIPKTDMASAVQTSLGKADSAYQKPSGGIPSTDMTSAVVTSLGKADTALQQSNIKDVLNSTSASDALSANMGKKLNDEKYAKPSTGIPASDFASGVQTSLGLADSAYQKPSTGIPKSDLASGVQTSLGKADSAYQKPSGGIPATDLTSAVQTSLGKADSALQSASIYDGLDSTATNKSLSANQGKVLDGKISTINSKIPNQASSSNQLADKEFVNSSITTNTANYISNNGQPFTSVAQLEAYSGTVTNNDYAFVTGTDSGGNSYYDRYKATVSGSTVTWDLEYRLNNSSFTAAQWSAINSDITAALVSSYSSHVSDTDIHVTTSNKSAWNAKYDKPAGGIPKTDLAGAVQTSLGKADTAYQKASTGIPKTDLASGVQTSLGLADSSYQKPSTGIPKTDLASAVQTSLGKADSALQSHQPVTDSNPSLAWGTKSKVATIGSTDIHVTMPSNPDTWRPQPDWNATTGDAVIKNKPSLATVATSGSYNDLSNKPTIPAAQVQTDWNATSGMGVLKNKPSLATVATSGSYNDLSNKPSIPAAQVQTDWNATSGMGVLLNKPSALPASDVSAWAKASTKPAYTASEVGAVPTTSIVDNLTTADAAKVLSAKQGKVLNDKISSMTSTITISAQDITDFISQVVNNYLGSYKTKISVIAEWSGNDFYTFEMTLLDSTHCYGTVCNIFSSMAYKNYNFSYNAGNVYLYNLLSNGSNSNGSYMILNDDVLICWGTVSYQITEWTRWEYCYEASPGTTITFPKTFASSPHIYASATTSTNACTGVELGLLDTTHVVNCYAIRPATGSVPSTAYIDWLAIGTPV